MPYAAYLAGIEPVTSAVTTVRHVAMDGTLITELASANVTSVEWEHNGPGSCSFTMHPLDPDAADLDFPDEIQVWRNAQCIWWGYITRYTANRDTVEFQCSGLLHYFDFRHFGEANRTNLLTNGSFEDDGTGWTASGVTASYPASDDNLPSILGAKVALLEQATAGVDTHLIQVVPYASSTLGDVLTLVAWFFISPIAWGGPALEARGLYWELRDETDTVRANASWDIDDSTPRGSWQRAEMEFYVPPSVTWTINVRLYAPATFIFWDAVSLTAMESLSLYRADQAYIVERTVNYAQDLDVWVHGKSNLNISATSTTCPPTGVLRDEHKQFAEHDNIGRFLHDYTQLENGIDVSVEHTATARAMHTWYPSKGTDRTGSVTITNDMLAAGANEQSFDGEQAVSSVVVLGDGSGPDREEGGASDPARFDGVTFEKVVSARSGTLVSHLEELAVEQLRAGAYPTSATVTVHEPTALLLEVVDTGDLLTLDIDHGRWQIQGAYHVVAIAFDPVKEALTFELNSEEP